MTKLLLKLDTLSKQALCWIPEWSISLIFRISVFLIFWLSAQTKIAGLTWAGITLGETTLIGSQHFAFWSVTDSTVMLFEYEYGLPLLPPAFAAYMATITEFIFSLFILFGVFTRFSALIFLGMTAVIQIFVYPDAWSTHLLWVGLLLYLLKQGAGKISIDSMVFGRRS